MTTDTFRDERLIEGVVANLPLFSGLAPARLRALAMQCSALAGPRGMPILQGGARMPGVLAVAFGSVKLALRNGGDAARVLRVVAARETFGEAAALLGRAAPYDAVAVSEVKVIVIPAAPLVALLEAEPRFARSLVSSLAERKLQLCAEIGSATLQRGGQRLASYLDELANGSNRVQLPFSKTLLAARLGMKKETLSRLLRQLADGGVITVERRTVVILDRERLRQPVVG